MLKSNVLLCLSAFLILISHASFVKAMELESPSQPYQTEQEIHAAFARLFIPLCIQNLDTFSQLQPEQKSEIFDNVISIINNVRYQENFYEWQNRKDLIFAFFEKINAMNEVNLGQDFQCTYSTLLTQLTKNDALAFTIAELFMHFMNEEQFPREHALIRCLRDNIILFNKRNMSDQRFIKAFLVSFLEKEGISCSSREPLSLSDLIECTKKACAISTPVHESMFQAITNTEHTPKLSFFLKEMLENGLVMFSAALFSTFLVLYFQTKLDLNQTMQTSICLAFGITLLVLGVDLAHSYRQDK